MKILYSRKRRRLLESKLLRSCYLVTLDKGRNFHVHTLDNTDVPRTIRLPQFPKPVAFQTVIKSFDSAKLSVLSGSGSWNLDTTGEWISSGKIQSLSPQWLSTFAASYATNEVCRQQSFFRQIKQFYFFQGI